MGRSVGQRVDYGRVGGEGGSKDLGGGERRRRRRKGREKEIQMRSVRGRKRGGILSVLYWLTPSLSRGQAKNDNRKSGEIETICIHLLIPGRLM